jgi:F-type H+-transporting ATPase subunit b
MGMFRGLVIASVLVLVGPGSTWAEDKSHHGEGSGAEVIPPKLQEKLKLTPEQKERIHERQKDLQRTIEREADLKNAIVQVLDEDQRKKYEESKHSEGIFAWALDLFVWTLAVFLLLLFILTKYAWKPMLEALRKREDAIRSAVDEAKHARAETERVRNEFQAEMAKAYAEIPKMMDQARKDAQTLAEEMRAKALADIQAERQRLRREIETARDQALKELQDHAANLATLISAKALKRAVSAEDHRRLVDEALVELHQSGKERR